MRKETSPNPGDTETKTWFPSRWQWQGEWQRFTTKLTWMGGCIYNTFRYVGFKFIAPTQPRTGNPDYSKYSRTLTIDRFHPRRCHKMSLGILLLFAFQPPLRLCEPSPDTWSRSHRRCTVSVCWTVWSLRSRNFGLMTLIQWCIFWSFFLFSFFFFTLSPRDDTSAKRFQWLMVQTSTRERARKE